MDILINNPIKISIDTREIDDRLPSFYLYVSIEIEKFDYVLKVAITSWFECEVFDSFIRNIQSSKLAIFHDMNNNFRLEIDLSANRLYWFSCKTDINGNEARSEGHETINIHDKDNILSTFKAYPKWW